MPDRPVRPERDRAPGASGAAALDRLREEAARFRASFDLAPVGMAHVALGGQFLAVNRRLCAVLGYERDELLALRFQDLTHPEDLAADLDQALRLVAGEIPSYTLEKRYRHKDGRTIWARLSASLVRDERGAPFHLVAVVEDVTAQKDAERALAAREAGGGAAGLLAQVLAAIPDVVAVKDRDQRYLVANDACAAVFGRPVDAIVGRTDEELQAADVAAALQAVDQRVIATGEAVTVTEWVPSAEAGGGPRAWTSVKAPLRGPDGAAVGVVLTARDETDRLARERLDRVLRELDDALRPLGDPDAITAAATAVLGRALDAGRANYTEVDEAAGVLRVRQNFTQRGMPDAVGTYQLADLAPLLPSFRAGAPVVIPDTRADPRTAPIVAAPEIAAVQTLALLDVPLVKDGALVGVLSVNHPAPRAWTADEVALVAAVAERTWAAAERARSARQLADQVAELETLYAATPVGLCVLDRALRYVRVNERLAEINGFPAAAHLGKTVRELLPDIADAAEPALRRVLETGEPVRDLELRGTTPAQPGVERVWLEQWLPLRDAAGAVVGVHVVAEEVTEQRRLAADREALLAAERRAREAAELERRRLEAVLAALPVGVAVADAPDGRLRYANDAVRAIWGQPPAARAVAESSLDWAGYHVDADGRATARRYAPAEWPLARALLTGVAVHDEAIDAERPDGERRRVAVSAAPIRDAAGAVVGGVVAIADVSEAARAREALEAARRAAEAANRAKSDFLATMSHELRTPLNAISGHVQLLEMELHGPVTDPQREALGRVGRAQRHLLRLITDVLNYAKLEAGKVEFDVRRTLVADVLADVVPLVEPQLAAKGLRLTVSLPEDADRGEGPVHVWADREKLGQVLLNLLANAAKFTPAVQPDGTPGHVRVRLATRPDAPDVVFLRVRDTGVGIPPAKQASIFEPFVQAHTGYARPAEGTGLGLAIARDLARGMGGDLGVQSAEGAGSMFTVTLRRVTDAPGAQDAPGEPGQPPQ